MRILDVTKVSLLMFPWHFLQSYFFISHDFSITIHHRVNFLLPISLRSFNSYFYYTIMFELKISVSTQLLIFWSQSSWIKIISSKDVENKNLWLMILILLDFFIMMKNITCHLEYIYFAYFSMIILTIYFFFDNDKACRLILILLTHHLYWLLSYSSLLNFY